MGDGGLYSSSPSTQARLSPRGLVSQANSSCKAPVPVLEFPELRTPPLHSCCSRLIWNPGGAGTVRDCCLPRDSLLRGPPSPRYRIVVQVDLKLPIGSPTKGTETGGSSSKLSPWLQGQCGNEGLPLSGPGQPTIIGHPSHGKICFVIQANHLQNAVSEGSMGV